MSKKKRDDKVPLWGVGREVKLWISGILSFSVAFIFILAAFHKAGIIGEKIYLFCRELFGLGYFLFPFVFILLGITLVRREKPSFLPPSLIGAFLVFLSGLGILHIAKEGGGLTGKLIVSPLVKFFDVYVSFILFIAIFLIALPLTLNKLPSLSWLYILKEFAKKKLEKEIPVQGMLGENLNTSGETKEIGQTPAESSSETLLNRSGKSTEDNHAPKIFSFEGSKKQIRGRVPVIQHLFLGKEYAPPPLSLLDGDRGKPSAGDIKANANVIKRTLQEFGIDVEMDEISIGPSITRYAFKPAQGVKLSRIIGLQNDLSLALAAHPLRIEAPIPGQSLVGIEIPNTARITVGLATLFQEEEFFRSTQQLLITLGRSVTGKPYFGSIPRMPHLLIAGTTGSGKSVAIHSILTSLIYRNSPENLRFILIDPKRIELTLYNKIPHLYVPVITDPKKAILTLKWAAQEMGRRYDVFEAESVRDIHSYHKNIVEPAYKNAHIKNKMGDRGETVGEEPDLPERMPYFVIVVDELADIMGIYPRELESAIVRLAQMSRAVGIHLILSTQRPSVNVVTGLIKANIPTRMAFQVPSQTDSRTILDMGGAEKLLGAGDLLYMSGEMAKPVRLQSAFVSEEEIKSVVKYLSEEYGESYADLNLASFEGKNSPFDALQNENEDLEDDELYEEARETIIRDGKASATRLQSKLRIGYSRATRILDMLEEKGVVGPIDSSKRREVLIKYGSGELGSGNGTFTG